MTAALSIDDFDDFYEQVHRQRPFPWQNDLVRQVVDRGAWPGLVDVPTGLGKTALIDIAVFVSALTAKAPGADRLGRRRIFFVVDRRIVVDQAHERAGAISRALDQATEGVMAAVADRLRGLGDPEREQVLPVVRMRGGVTWDSAWLPRPDLPGVVTGTVDQVGSRLFFRGYGVSPRRWSIDAALVGSDSLVLVDEAHLATAMTTTLDSALSYDASVSALAVPAPAVVQLTATTARPVAGWTYALDVDRHLAPEQPEAARRLRAGKVLRTVSSGKAAAVKDLAAAAVAEAARNDARVLVVCNTIDRARLVHTLLLKSLPKGTDLGLLIGRSRPIDREAVVTGVMARFAAGSSTGAPGAAVLVATQTVEVGVDLDATGLVTESASWDALVQRIGRLNRRGDLTEPAPAIVVHDDDPAGPVYGASREVCWRFLVAESAKGDLDVSPLGCRALTERVPASAYLPVPTAPLLLPAHLDAWTRTAPAPTNDAPVDPYLHGLEGGVAPVSLVWRDGLETGWAMGDDESTLVIDVIPVRAAETVEVPLGAVRRWLSGTRPTPLGEWDDEDEDVAFADDEPDYQVVRRAVDPDGTVRWQWARARDLRPGDQVVVPSARGGLDRYGWSPGSTEPVPDVAEVAALDAGRPVLRIDEGLPARLGVADPGKRLWEEVWTLRAVDNPDKAAEMISKLSDEIRDLIASDTSVESSPWDDKERRARLGEALVGVDIELSSLTKRGKKPSDEQRLLRPVAIMRSGSQQFAGWQDARDDTVDGTTHGAEPVRLSDHLESVRARAISIAGRLGLPEPLRRVVGDAARWHDLGKVDPRFQAMLFDGDPIRAAMADEPRAKSGMAPGETQRHQHARRRSGLPRGARHEAWSAALVAAHLRERGTPYDGDQDLLLHLVASHHGHARPLLPPVVDLAEHRLSTQIDGLEVSAELPHRVDVEAAERFAVLNARYGRWGLALLESAVRCADTTVSGEGR